MDVAYREVVGELTVLAENGGLGEDVEPALSAADLVARYEQLWAALTVDEVMPRDQQRFRIAERVRQLHALGFDVDQMDLIDEPGGGSRLRLTTRVAEPGHHRRALIARTGLLVEANQARRFLADIATYRAWLEHVEQRSMPEMAAAARWLSEVYEPALAAVPPDVRRRLDDAEIYHGILEHRWFLSEAAGTDVGMPAAVADYVDRVLTAEPVNLVALPPQVAARGADHA